MLAFILIAFFYNFAFASNDKTGTTGAAFTKLFGGVRPASLGGAFIALSDDTNGIYYNPAGISQIKDVGFSSGYMSYIAGMSYANISTVVPYKRSSFGFSVDYLSAGVINETTLAKPTGTGSSINPFSYSAAVSFAQKIIPSLSIGANLKILGAQISNDTSNGYGGDVGLLWKINDAYAIGLSGRNVMGSFGGKTLPLNYGVGFSYNAKPVIVLADYNMPNDNKAFVSLGAEYNLSNNFYGRVGFNTKSEEKAGANLGVGLGLKLGDLKLDYAYIPYGDLGTAHRVALSFNPYGKSIPRLSEILITPDKAGVRVGGTVKFYAQGIDQRGEKMNFSPTWKVDGGVGEIHYATGVFVGQRSGKGKITAYQSAIIDNIGNTRKIYKSVPVTVFMPKKSKK